MPLARLLFIAVLTAIAVLAVRQTGALEALELAAYDQGVRWRSGSADPGDHVTVVAIDDAGLEKWGWPVPDGTLDALIGKVLDLGASVVCLDIYRDKPVPPGDDLLARRLRDEGRLVGALKYPDPAGAGISAPPAIEDKERKGFTDVVPGQDGKVRRGLLYLGGEGGVETALALQCAKLVLAGEGVRPQPARNALSVAIGETVLMPLTSGFAGYSQIDARGHQFMLDYRATPGAVPVVSGLRVLDGSAARGAFDGRIALIGTISQKVRDAFHLPVAGGAGDGQTYGVVLHALIADQVLRLAHGLNGPTRAFGPWGEAGLVFAATFFAALAMRRRRFAGTAIAGGLTAVVCLVLGYLGLLADWWLPAVPAAISVMFLTILINAFGPRTVDSRT